MRKTVGFLIVGLFLSIPLISSATLIGTGELNVSWSIPTSGGSPNYYADYDGRVLSSNFGYTTDWEEIFCVSKDHANSLEVVDFYSINPDLDAIFSQPGLFEGLAQAAWIADNWTTFGSTATLAEQDALKGEAQKAVWKVMGVMDRLEGAGTDFDIFNASAGHTNYLTTNWYYAHSPGGGTSANYQDYLTPTAPVPEPATMILLGTGLIGIAGLGRRKLKKK